MTARRGPGDQLLDLCRQVDETLVLCAPFVKAAVVERLLAATPPSARVELFTRWRPEEVAAGVSDTRVLPLIEHHGGDVHLYDPLHAKFYRSESSLLVGSANLTATALGWIGNPNLELLVDVPLQAAAEVEQVLRDQALLATAELAEEVERVAALLPAVVRVPDAPLEHTDVAWFPGLREPADLYIAYARGLERLSSASANAAARDLHALDLPAGLTSEGFSGLVAHRLRTSPHIRHMDRFLSEPRRFGAVRDEVARVYGIDRTEAEVAWQTMMRWMLEFLPERYERRVTNWSEVFVCVGDVA